MKNIFNSLKICIFAVMFLTAFQANAGSRYLRLTALGGVRAYTLSIEEISWLVGTTAYPTTFATGETPAITATLNPTTAWKVFDGISNNTSLWNQPEFTTFPFSITCDLGAGVSIDPTEIKIANEWNGRCMSAFLCEGSSDNITWTTLCIKSGLPESSWVDKGSNNFAFASGSSDTQTPSVPASLSSSAITQTSFTTSWVASTDDVAVTGYLIYKGTTLVGFSSTNSFALALLEPSTTYNMTVKAVDAAGNISNASNSFGVTTAVGNIPVGSITLMTSNFTGTAPSSSLPWTKTSALDSHFTFSGWNKGAGTLTANPQIDNAFAIQVSAGETSSTLQEAIADNEYVTFTVTPKTGFKLNLNSAAVTFKVKLDQQGQSPSKFSVFTGIKSFTAGNEIYTSTTADVNASNVVSEQPITFNFPATGYDNITTPIVVRVYLHAARYDGKTTSITSWTMSGKVSENLPTGHLSILTSDFTGTAPSLNLPWTKTSVLDSHLTFSGWNRGAGTLTANPQIDNAFAIQVSAGGTSSTLQQAIDDNEYITFAITPNTGSKLSLNSALVAFKVKLSDEGKSPSKFSVFTGVKGFTAGNEVYTTTSTDVDNWNVTSEQPITFYFPATGYDNITTATEVRVYVYAAQYDGKRTSITSWTMSGQISDVLTDLKLDTANKNTLVVYPNPAFDMLSLNIGSTVGNGTIAIYDTQGRNVIKQSIATQIENIDISKLTSGIYFIKVSQGDKVLNSKFVKK